MEKRVEALEAQAGDPGRLIVWRKSDGDPEPEHGPDDVLIVVLREGDEPGTGPPGRVG